MGVKSFSLFLFVQLRGWQWSSTVEMLLPKPPSYLLVRGGSLLSHYFPFQPGIMEQRSLHLQYLEHEPTLEHLVEQNLTLVQCASASL